MRLQRCKKIFGVVINSSFIVYKEGFYWNFIRGYNDAKKFLGVFINRDFVVYKKDSMDIYSRLQRCKKIFGGVLQRC